VAVSFIASASASGTRLTTNSRRASMLASVSFGPPLRLPTPTQTTGGWPPKQLKNENGAALTRPCASADTTQAIGRGTTVAVSSL
jgi:hypothetical protein